MLPGAPLDPRALLRRLLPAVSPARTDGPRAPIEACGFEDLLLLAARGGLESGRPVDVPARAGVDPPLDDDQRARLGAAADRAEAAGVRRALVMLDGRGLVLEVPERSIASELREDGAEGGIVRGVEAAVLAPGRPGGAASGDPLATDRAARGSHGGGPGGVLRPPGGLMPPGAARDLLEARAADPRPPDRRDTPAA